MVSRFATQTHALSGESRTLPNKAKEFEGIKTPSDSVIINLTAPLQEI
jgi:hypothetical protein